MRLSILIVIALAGCATCPPPPAPRVVDTACSWVTPMTADASDTAATKREIIAYEIARQKNCPAGKKP
ncbi:hypothetical protein PQQ99_07845 [Paraburkholderia sediminicola]|uniref:hypothetical protein n=1 Tax=Paraburkholderia sediminicola TaxID=458836 RepID=UPI0038B984D6